jgi:maltokinase
MAASDVAGAIARGDASALSPDVLAEWITGQRWFGSKARDVGEFNVLDVVVLRDQPPVLAIVVVEARFRAGTHELYQLPLGVRPVADAWERGVIAEIDGYTVYDALTDPEQASLLADLLTRSAEVDRPSGCVRFNWEEAASAPGPQPSIRAMRAEQSNTSVVFDERLVLKVFRRIEPGINPELEMLRFLTGHGFAHVAALAGWYGYTGELMDATLGVMQEFVSPARDGWELALDALADGDDGFLDRLGELGEVTGRMHSVLASDSSDHDFAPEEPSDENVSLLTATIDEQIERLFLELPDHPALAPIAGRGEEVRDQLQQLSHTGVGGRLIRHHGDYHLGQTVYGPEGWVILDFEGEPGRPLLERRRKRSPLRDVAGMLRSFAYAASAVEMLRGTPPPEGWELQARERFLSGYVADVDLALLPAGQVAIHKLLAIFELEKAIYELRYELNNRPDWVRVPVMGIARLLEGAPA